MTTPILAWWFAAGDTLPNGDGRKIVVGEKLTVKPPLKLCKHGLHGSISCLDALDYATGPWLHRTSHTGKILHGEDKLCSTGRTVLARVDFTPQLRLFARECAMDVIHLWDAPPIVREFLGTGDDSKRDAARDAAWDAAQAAARAAARAAAGSAAWAAARAAAWDTAGSAARAAARAAAWDAAWDTAGSAARAKQVTRLEQLALEAVGEAKP